MPQRLAKPVRPWALRLLPPFPAVAQRLLSLVDNDTAAAAQISDCIKLAPAFTAEILRVANSPLFGAVREVYSVKHAVGLLGLDRVKAMAVLIGVNAMVIPAMRIEALRKFWVHSLVTAILTEESARVSKCCPDGAYTAGLLHNLGVLGLMSAYPEEYAGMIDVSTEYGFDFAANGARPLRDRPLRGRSFPCRGMELSGTHRLGDRPAPRRA